MNNTSLLDLTLPRTLDEWVARFEQRQWNGAQVQGWLFEGLAARRAAEQRLAAVGVTAQLRSAYKPLLRGDTDCGQALFGGAACGQAFEQPALDLCTVPLALLESSDPLVECAWQRQVQERGVIHYGQGLKFYRRVDAVTQPVAQQVQAQHREHDGHAGEDADPPGGLHIGAAIGQHAAPTRNQRVNTQAQECQAALKQDVAVSYTHLTLPTNREV